MLKKDDMRQPFASLGLDPITGTQSQAQTTFKTEVEKWGKMVTTRDLTANWARRSA